MKIEIECVSFEAAQSLLQRAGKQLAIPDQEAQKAKDRVALLIDKIFLDCFDKSIRYDLPISDKMRKELELMNGKRLLSIAFKLDLTPKGLAVRYLVWLHASLGTEEPNPLEGWLRELETHIHQRHRDHRPHHLFRAAERQIFIWVGLYVAALQGWCEEVCTTLPLLEIAMVRAKVGLFQPELRRRLIEQRVRLLDWVAVMGIIEEEELHAPILPNAWRSLLAPAEFDFVIESLGRPGGRGLKICQPAECVDRARAKVKTLLTTTCVTADIFKCHDMLLTLTQAQLTLMNRRQALKEFSVLLSESPSEAGHDRRKPARSSRS